ncbi:GTPase [Thermosynechococcaceae cyanobacterium BACA0444]|uniref:GTPase n=1 Tax=Pseudocalidococcus azoricus BACA0444 TaxID=2918990 RepID=A0AAE4JZS5_9CYAN|nr:GTPase [Pseudocalidococcus azoricus]MDS3862484.1 GTPase [Pseudocalidococcus azoricus BACA0444]
MIKLKGWQIGVLALPIVAVGGLVTTAALIQIHAWGLDWLWAVVIVMLLAWRLLLLRWLAPSAETELLTADFSPQALGQSPATSEQDQQAQARIQTLLQTARQDPPPWDNWPLFWQRMQALLTEVALIYNPTVKRPLLHIYVPQAYRLMRDTVEDVDRWMMTLGPVLNRVTVGQAIQAYELYEKLAPAARWGLQAWNWVQWITNPAVAVTKVATQGSQTKANQELLANLGQLLREQTLRALGVRAMALYGSKTVLPTLTEPTLEIKTPQTETLADILTQASDLNTPPATPLNLLIAGRTGAGKSSLINTLFTTPQTQTNVLPNTAELSSYRWQNPQGEDLILWDSPGYEQINRPDYQAQVVKALQQTDVLILVTPALDPALQMDLKFLTQVNAATPDIPILILVSQVDKLRPIREWQPPYDWQYGQRPKESAMREALSYRRDHFQAYTTHLLPMVMADPSRDRPAWGEMELIETLLGLIDPAQQARLGRCLKNRDLRVAAARQIIDRYALIMGSAQGITSVLKGPLLQFISTFLTGSPAAAWVLAEKLPLEKSPVILAKVQMAVELFSLLGDTRSVNNFNLAQIWPLLLFAEGSLAAQAWALGQTLVEYWSMNGNSDTATGSVNLEPRYRYFLEKQI